MRYDLGGIGLGGERITVNLTGPVDVLADFLNLDEFCEDGSADEFYLSHSLEHIPPQRYKRFLQDLLRKLKPGGVLKIVQTDVKRTIDLYHQGGLSFRALRTVIFPPADRLRQNPLNQHFNMWGAEELLADVLGVGFSSAKTFDAGFWRLDTTDELFPGHVECFHGIPIPNLGLEAQRKASNIPEICSSQIKLETFERKIYSQNGEDGILLKLLDLFHIREGFYLEIGTESGVECNTRALRESGRFTGIMLDATYSNPSIGLHRAFVTAETILHLCDKYAVPSKIAVLSIDIDGNDYWIWKAISSQVSAEVVIIEYNSSFGKYCNVITPYDANFRWNGTNYYGASICALKELGKSLGYSLVYAEAAGVNLFFVKTSILINKSISFENQDNPGILYKRPKFGPTGMGHPNDSRTIDLVHSVQANTGIPKIIHQTWKSHSIDPPFKKEWRDTWLSHHPDWEYRLWTDDDLLEFIVNECPAFVATYNGYDCNIKRVDAARYLILQAIGGLFVDMDFVCLKPLSELLSGRSLVFGSQHAGEWLDTSDHVCNALMASTPRHPFWAGIEFDLSNYSDLGVLEATGPNFLTRRASNSLFCLNPKDLPMILPHYNFYPFAWNHPDKVEFRMLSSKQLQELFPISYAVTFWTATWLSTE